jgi:hypothetical protein
MPARPADDVQPQRIGDELEGWLSDTRKKTLGSLVELFGERSFAVLFIFLLGVPALPLPTGGATHVFELVAILLALESIVGRTSVWLPERWRGLELAGPKQQRFITILMQVIRRIERLSRPRLRFVFGRRASNIAFGLLVILGSLAAFLAPPFTGLDTLPALGVVLLSLGVLLEDFLIVIFGLAVMTAGIALEAVAGDAAIHVLRTLV